MKDESKRQRRDDERMRRMNRLSNHFRVALLLSALASLALPTLAAPSPVDAHAAKTIPAGEVIVVLNEQIFNALLEALFTLSTPPTYPLTRGGDRSRGGCASEITLARESEGTRTAVHFRDGRITAPIAFRGTYEAPVAGCLKFQGWADTNLSLSFDQTKQALTARVEVKSIRLRGLNSLLNGGVTGMVQDAIDARVNPIEVLRAEQVSAPLPLKGTSGNSLRLRATDVRSEVLPNQLRLRINYEFVRN